MATFLSIRYGMFLVSLCVCFSGSDTQCSSANRFGPDCEFFCHCMSNGQCNRSTGNCTLGCDFNWVGPGCQRKNLVPIGKPETGMVTRHQSNIQPTSNRQIAKLAVDRDLSTCSYTNYANKSRDIPWWRIWLKDKHTIRRISIDTRKEYLVYFRNFEVTVENNTFDHRYGVGFSDQEICYTHDNNTPLQTSIEVTCNKPLYGNQLRIRLARNHTQLVLCDMRIYGECDHGTFGASCTDKCSTHCNDICNKDVGTCTSCKSGWTGNQCNLECENGTNGVSCTDRCSSYCTGVCDKDNGVCDSCAPGWRGSHCNQKCEDGMYGRNCALNCSRNCRNNTICSKVDGNCKQGCSNGYIGNLCNEKCPEKTFGQKCAYNCSRNCFNGSSCMHTNGTCMNGCDLAWTGEICNKACTDGYYGYACLQKCSKNCVRGYSNCDIVYGSCMSGCTAGWRGRKCDEECYPGSWGLNCADKCGQCTGGICRHIDGVCFGGCATGHKPTPHCDEECDDGRWGENCDRTCLNCNNHTCDRINGTCKEQCKSGFRQTKYCDQECSSGWYGPNCSQECNPNCKNVTFCRKADGSCSECKLGFEGIQCGKAAKQEVTETILHISGGGLAGIILTGIILVFITAISMLFVARRMQQTKIKRSQNTFENEAVSYSNSLSESTFITLHTTEELNETENTDNIYDTIKRKSGNEHTYE